MHREEENIEDEKEHQAVHVAVAVRNNIIITREHFFPSNI
jgi:hypothetical protein